MRIGLGLSTPAGRNPIKEDHDGFERIVMSWIDFINYRVPNQRSMLNFLRYLYESLDLDEMKLAADVKRHQMVVKIGPTTNAEKRECT